MSVVWRILDANANRAREAMRVMEDAARFVLDDTKLSGGLKGLRHELASALGGLPGLALHRDTPGDVGTTLSTEAETRRESVAAVVIAAGKRLSEALRSLEEYGKTVDAGFAAKVEALRYRGYELERRLCAAMSGGRAPQWRVCVLLSEGLCPGGDWQGVAQRVIEGGADCVQLREKALEGGELLARARWLVGLTRSSEVSVVVNDRPDVAVLAGADGVHVGQGDLPCAAVRRLVGPRLWVGASTADTTQAQAAVQAGADYCGLGPMFASGTKPKETLAGLEYLRAFRAAFPEMPHLAISGITPENVGEVAAAGGRGVAVSSAVCAAPDPAVAVRALRSAWDDPLAVPLSEPA